MGFGLPISFTLHGVALLGGLFFMGRTIPTLDEGKVISVEILSLSDITNVRAAIKADKPDPLDESPEPMTLETPMENADEISDAIETRQDEASSEPTPDNRSGPVEPVEDETSEAEPEQTKTVIKEEPSFDLDRFSGEKAETQSILRVLWYNFACVCCLMDMSKAYK